MGGFGSMAPGIALLAAAQAGDIDGINTAMAVKGTDVETRDPDGKTALHLAAAKGQDRACRVLVHQHGASVYSKTKPEGDTALHLAAGGGHVYSVETLLYAGVDRDATNENGKTPASAAKAGKHKEIQNMLKEWQPSMSLVNKILGDLV